MSRTSNSIKNMSVSIAGQLLTVLFQFITRTALINSLGVEYLGISGLFTNIVSMLSLSELGIGTAIIFKLYKPIEENDEHKIFLLMNFYKRIYQIIGIVIFAIGIILMPFLSHLIKDDVSFINIYIIFFLYLMQSVFSYMFFAYKSALIQANQKEYITTGITYLFQILSNILQLVCLLALKDFTLFVLISIITTILMNIVISRICDKMYPFINKKSNEKLDKTEQKNIFKDCYALAIYKMNGVVLNSTGNMILSTFIGLSVVGLYSNYMLIFTFVNTILTKIYSAITASLGNLHAAADKEHEYEMFEAINLISFILFTVSALGMAFVSNSFITIWLGKEYLFSMEIVMLMGIRMYIDGQKKVLSTYRNTMGLFQQAKYRPLFGALINLIASVILVQYIGIAGILLGTIIADISTYMWYDPYAIYKYGFESSVKPYYKKRIIYGIVFLFVGGLCYGLTSVVGTGGILPVVLDVIICTVVPTASICALFYRTKEFGYAFGMVKNFLARKKAV